MTQTTLDSSFLDELKTSSKVNHISRHLIATTTTNRKCIIELTITHRQTDLLLCNESTIWCSHSEAKKKKKEDVVNWKLY